MFSNRQSSMIRITVIVFLHLTIIHSTASHCQRDVCGKRYLVLFTDDNMSAKTVIEPGLFYTSPSNTFNETNVHIFTPKWTNPQVFENINIQPKTSGVSFVSPSLHMVDMERASKVVLVESDYDILLNVLSHDQRSGNAFLSLQTEVLGTEYYPITYWPPSTVAQVAIATIYDNTIVTLDFPEHRGIRFTFDGNEVIGGTQISMVLQQYEAVQLQDRNDLTGTKITASKPIAVFSGNKRCSVKDDRNDAVRSHMMAQIPPVSTWGKTYLLFPLPSRPNNIFKLVAQRANTTVQVTGFGVTFIWVSRFDGDFKSEGFKTDNVPVKIQADKPILVVQWAGSRTIPVTSIFGNPIDPAMTILPPVEQFKNKYSFRTMTDKSKRYFVIITIAEEDSKELVMDGEPIEYSKWREFSNSMPRMVGAAIAIDQGWHELYHISGDVRFGVLVYGSSRHGMTYVYPAGMCMDNINSDVEIAKTSLPSTETATLSQPPPTVSQNKTDADVYIIKIAAGSSYSLEDVKSSTIAIATLTSIIMTGLVAVIILTIYCRSTQSFSAKSRALEMRENVRPSGRNDVETNGNGVKVKDNGAKDNDLNCQSEIIRTIYGK